MGRDGTLTEANPVIAVKIWGVNEVFFAESLHRLRLKGLLWVLFADEG